MKKLFIQHLLKLITPMHKRNVLGAGFISISSVFTYLSLPLLAFAQTPTPITIDPCAVDTSGVVQATGIAGILCKLGGGNIAKTIQGVVVFFIILAVVIALLYLLYGGIKWITSRGDKTEVEAARNHILAAIIGLIVVILAVFILSVVLAAFGIKATDLKIPVIGQ
ncbi:MAG: hypothetical protein A3B47_04255 [Candidatus Levybacteria bacterium RIFCSPLOWO2_01_FULL_39_24]|nr:MAG: hypothetical protein A3B47_04255 [Candidatus Levybacteria bacterium RIFCSPLOWO2_01_FULL_39_24]